ncbi:LicD family protein [Brevibacillus nitrificans]|uniref:LicD family protein n=1 Tax=Brevibacillus nitrificans TaxID=651560 RepID=UPI00262BF982|nr:LicD family protein [Brevibacillus nitrificans]
MKEEERLTTEIIVTPEQRRHIQLIQLELLLEIDRICRKHRIAYRMIGGTLIGAVRHKGFIPWDPDADVSMGREDYNRFFEVCQEELDSSRFFLQEWRTDPNYRWNYGRLLRNETEFVRAGHEELNTRNGIFVDIICTDFVPDSKLLRPIHSFSCFIIRKTLWSKVGKSLHPNFFLRKWYALLSFIPRDLIFHFRDWVVSWTKGRSTELGRNMAHSVSKKSSSRWGYPTRVTIDDEKRIKSGELPWDYYLTDLEFEGYKLMTTKFYEDGLKNTFGDYMKLPPVEERISHIPCSKLKLIKPEIPEFERLMKKIYTE